MSKLSKNEVLMLNIGSMCTGARVVAVSRQRSPKFLAYLLLACCLLLAPLLLLKGLHADATLDGLGPADCLPLT